MNQNLTETNTAATFQESVLQAIGTDPFAVLGHVTQMINCVCRAMSLEEEDQENAEILATAHAMLEAVRSRLKLLFIGVGELNIACAYVNASDQATWAARGMLLRGMRGDSHYWGQLLLRLDKHVTNPHAILDIARAAEAEIREAKRGTAHKRLGSGKGARA